MYHKINKNHIEFEKDNIEISCDCLQCRLTRIESMLSEMSTQLVEAMEVVNDQ